MHVEVYEFLGPRNLNWFDHFADNLSDHFANFAEHFAEHISDHVFDHAAKLFLQTISPIGFLFLFSRCFQPFCRKLDAMHRCSRPGWFIGIG